jgi:hypothetical protein
MFKKILEAFWLAQASERARRGDVSGAEAALRRIGKPRYNRALTAVMRAHLDIVNGRHEGATAQIGEARRLATGGSKNAEFILLYCDNLESVIDNDVAVFNRTASALQFFPQCNAQDLVVIVRHASDQDLHEIRAMFVSRAVQ